MAKCPNCKMAVSDEARFCPDCGARLEPRHEIGQDGDFDSNPPDSKTTRESMFYVGAILGVVGVLFLPFFFFLVALPEAIIHLINGGSTLDALGKDARDNPAMKGTFLIFRWFGNFLLLMIVLGFILGILLVIG